jgi:ABC-type glycerol-3-phosphate transport system substrate-binding protein
MEREKGLTGMRLSRRDLLRGLVSMGLGAGALSTLTACGAQPAPATQAPASKEQPTEAPKQEAPTQAAATPAPATATKITYWTFWADRWGEFQGQIIDAFNKSQSEIQVEMLIAPWGELNTKLLTAISAGQPPDFTIIGRSDAIEYALRGGILPLDDRIASDSRVKPDDWFEVAWKEVQWRGKIYALPFESGTYAAWLNVDLFKEVGLDPAKPPITWSETDIAADERLRPAGLCSLAGPH